MTAPKHTPEPWRLSDGYIDYGTIRSIDQQLADNARKVACVNACAGLNPEAIPALVEAARKALDRLDGSGYACADQETWSADFREILVDCMTKDASTLRAALAAVRGEK